jgi:SAM-dependent methyltransferase
MHDANLPSCGATIQVYNGDVRVTETLNLAYEQVALLLSEYNFSSILDVGSGPGKQANIFRAMGKNVTTIDPVAPADLVGDFLQMDISGHSDVVFCSHVLEHQRNIGLFLDKLIAATKPDGYLAISVPPEVMHHVGFEHPNHFSAGSLIYHLVLAGIDCRSARILTYGYNLSVITPIKMRPGPVRSWALGKADCAPYFPSCFEFMEGLFYGPILSHNWDSMLNHPPHFNAGL